MREASATNERAHHGLSIIAVGVRVSGRMGALEQFSTQGRAFIRAFNIRRRMALFDVWIRKLGAEIKDGGF